VDLDPRPGMARFRPRAPAILGPVAKPRVLCLTRNDPLPCESYIRNEIRALRLKHGVDLRTAAMINGIDKVARSYKSLGIFP